MCLRECDLDERFALNIMGMKIWVDQSGASCHVIMRNFHVSMYSSICT